MVIYLYLAVFFMLNLRFYLEYLFNLILLLIYFIFVGIIYIDKFT